MADGAPRRGRGSGAREALVRLLRANWLAIALLVAGLVALRFVENFYTPANMKGLTLAISRIGMVACTMLFCLASGDFDLSVESVLLAAGILAAVVLRDTGNAALAIAAGLSLGVFVGLVNGLVITKLRINALIATLATMQMARGFAQILCGGQSVTISSPVFGWIGTGTVLGIPNPVVAMLVCFIVFGFLQNKTTFGANTLAIGGNREAARLAGIPVDRIKITIFTMQGLVAGAAGIVLAAMIGSGQPNEAAGFSLDVISACVLGGVSLSGGVGTIQGVAAGVLVLGSAQKVQALLNIPFFYQNVITGAILLIAVLLDQLRRRQHLGTGFALPRAGGK
jgi:L-arabinose transport system permease protein